MTQERSLAPELMDDLNLGSEELRNALHDLALLNSLGFAHLPFLHKIRSFCRETDLSRVRIIDVASGGGENLCKLVRGLIRHGVQATGLGLDINPRSTLLAGEQARAMNVPVSFAVRDVLAEDFPEQADIVMCSLFLHHLPADSAASLLRRMYEASRHLLLVSDLLRSRANAALVWLASRLFCRSPIVHFDAMQSVRSAYSLSEMRELLDRSGLSHASLTRQLPERLFITTRKL